MDFLLPQQARAAPRALAGDGRAAGGCARRHARACPRRGHRLTAIRAGLEDDAEKLASAIRAAALVADRGRALAKEVRALSQGLGGRLLSGADTASSEGGMTIELEHRSRLFTVEFGREGGKGAFGTRVRAARAASPSERFTLRRRPGRSPPRGAPDPSGDDALPRA
ncbi:hypothetical protein WME79_25670 [Sorangium sp. So ce726]|uniref:hypothetical protein n=1 Tax=Sorangium sp. So ce726 TaxID=3133319 RepID=UPI003F5FB4C1